MARTRTVIPAMVVAAASISAPWLAGADSDQKITKREQIPFKYAVGQQKYVKLCAECHGEWMRGTDKGPPLLHGYYKPGHHGDRAFYRAILKGSQQHHWTFGDMPPVAGATPRDAQQIVPFVRWLQQAEGLF